MKSYNKDDIIFQYRSSCDKIKQSTLVGDYKTNNKEGKTLIKIFKYFENNKDLAKLTLPFLFYDENEVTRTKAAAHCLALNIFIDEAVNVLQETADDESAGIFAFNAKMTLKVWKEQGYLRVYPKK